MAQHDTEADLTDPIVPDDEAAGAHGVADYAAEPGEGVAHSPGMPQLEVETFPNQIFWLVVALFAIYWILTRIALPRIGAVLAERQGTITNDIAAAEDLKRQATEAEAAYETALAEARSQSQEIAAKTRADIQADLDRAIAEADERIAAQSAESEARIAEIRAGAMESVGQVARETAAEIVRALSPSGQVDQAAIDRAVAERTGDAA